MAQFDVRRNPNGATCDIVPYLLEVQSDLLEPLATRVVVPLVLAAERPKPAKHLNPCLTIEGRDVVMLNEQMAGVPVSAIGARVGSLAQQRQEIMAALDFLFTGI